MKSRKILIVEDSDQIRMMLAVALEIEGYEVLQAENGLEALKLLGESPQLPDLILLDMLMPLMNGWEFVVQLKKDRSNPLCKIPIIAVTATSEKVERAPGEIQSVIKKPVDLEILYSTIAQALG